MVKQLERQYGFSVKRIQTDGESTLGRIIEDIPATGGPFKVFLDETGIRKVLSAPSNPQSNGVAERLVRYVKEKTNTLMIARKNPKNLWNYVVTHVVRLHNVLPKAKTLRRGPNGKPISPHELLMSKKPDVSNEHEFYAACWAYDAKHLVKGERAARCNYLGMAQHTYGYLVRDVTTGRIFPSRTLVFNERFSPRSPGTFEEIDQNGHTVILEPPPLMPRYVPGVPNSKPSWWDDTMPISLRSWPPDDQTWTLGYVAERCRQDPTPPDRPTADVPSNAAAPHLLGDATPQDPPPAEHEPRRSTREGAGKRLAADSSVLEEWFEIRRRHDAIKDSQRGTTTASVPGEQIDYPDKVRTSIQH